MSADIAEIGFKVDSQEVSEADRKLKGLNDTAAKTGTATDRMLASFQRLNRLLGTLALAAGGAMAAFTAASVKAAIDAEETASKFQVVFRGSVVKANEALIELSKTIPMTVNEMRGMSASIQDMLVPMGIARDEAAELSVNAVKLAGDLGSFNNVTPEVALQAITSGLAGQSEALRRYGINASAARLEAIAYEEGLVGVGEELTTAAKAQALFIAVTQDSADAMGDAERTAGSTANQLKFMARDIRQAKLDLGTLLIPTFNEFLTMVNRVDDEGMTPLMATMQSISISILTMGSYLLQATAGWKILSNEVSNFLARFTDKSVEEHLAGLMDVAIPGAGKGFLDAYGGEDGETERAAGHRKVNDEIAQGNAELEKSLESLFAMAAALDAAILKLQAGVPQTLEETKLKLDDTNTSMGGTAETAALSAEAIADLANWWQKLLTEVDPVAAAALEFRLQEEMLNLAIKNGVADANLKGKAMDSLRTKMWNASLAAEKMRSHLREVVDIKVDDLDSIIKFDELKAMIDPAEAALQRFNDALYDMNEVRKDFEKDGVFFGDAFWKDMEAGLKMATMGADDLGTNLEKAGTMAGDALRTIQSSMDQGSKAYKAMDVAIQISNVAKAIGAILQQGTFGDPYTAIPRMAAMAAAVAALGVSVGNVQGGFSDTSKERQEKQGTGTVLGDMEAKSESIMNAVEITAAATSELVGINRSMLNALNSLVTGLGGASSAIARNPLGEGFADFTKNVNFSENNILGKILSGFMGSGGLAGKIWDALLGGKSEVTDQGIAILSGSIAQLIDGTLIKAFQEIQYKKWKFGSKHTKEEMIALGDEAAQQIGLVFQAISDTVREGALALGISATEIQAALDAFRVAEMHISLKDLSAEEQQAELEAVFGQIFDNLAEAVIPWLDQFQKVGEGLGETLVRVATSVQVMHEAISMLGLSVDETDPEKFAQISVGLIEMAGGIDDFISSMNKFIDKFATDDWKNAVAVDAVTRAFSQIGVTLPDTRQGLWDFVQGLDVSTEAGQRMLATILGLTDSLDTYYEILEKGDKERLERIQEQLALERDFRSKFDTSDWVNTEAVDKATQAFARLGLTLPTARDGLWKLLQGLDPIADAEKIAEIYGLINVLDIYYSTLEDGDAERIAREKELEDERKKIFDNEVQALLDIQAIAESVSDMLTSLRDMIVGDLSTPEENYDRSRQEAERLAESLKTMTDPAMIEETVRRIEQLTRSAYGLLDEDQKKLMGQGFLDFIDAVKKTAMDRIGAIADDTLNASTSSPAAILERFNKEVTNPLILVSGLQETAALRLEQAAAALMNATGANFSIAPNSQGSPIAAEEIKTAIAAGMEAGAQSMVNVSVELANAILQSANLDENSRRAIANAISSIPSRIEIRIDSSEFA